MKRQERHMKRQHEQTSKRPRHRAAFRVRVAAMAVLTGAAVAGAMAFAVSPGAASHRRIAAAHEAQAASRGAGPGEGPAAPLRVLSVSPGSDADPVGLTDPVRVAFSAPLAPTSPLPVFSPPIAGSWHADGAGTLVFTPDAPISPVTEVTLRVPAGPSGVRSAAGAQLMAPVVAAFQAGGWSTLRLEQLLAQLGYLPLAWVPDSGSGYPARVGSGPTTVSYTQRAGPATEPGGGAFVWQGKYPAALTSLWQPGQPGVILTGALMAFESGHGLPMTGTVSRGLWQALLNAAAQGQQNPHGYTYAMASKALPETLTVWHDGRVVVHGLANTGAPATPSPDGTWPVYLRNRSQVMRGLMPDGSPYADPVHFVSFFHGNFAVHSMSRPSYGSPQSLGCVELPLSEARRVWPYLTYGSLVSVAG